MYKASLIFIFYINLPPSIPMPVMIIHYNDFSLCYLSQLFPYHYLAKRRSAYLVICFINLVGGLPLYKVAKFV